ncbi:AAA family ATPase [Methylobacterium sp. J-048]|uniref:nucleotide-binding protein n=1 Tax=Methylobacterium sp. J-048 TaxID=2836635 RepID=UPI001FB92A91|nr:AAA family ATPase [Methylobacterium sp. J-048]MCJ2059826.1 AAA family ATPase [Methylobacterium sp. J-048]
MAAQKGGAGKTTLATSLAVAAVQTGEIVVAIDLDPQGSLREWSERRETADIVFRPVEAAGLAALLKRLRDHGKTTLVVVDTAGVIGPEVTVALQNADLALLPVRPSLLDLTATRRTAERLEALKRPYAFVLNQTQAAASARVEDAAEALVEIGPLYPGSIALRTDHLDAMAMGMGVTEWRPRSPAADEIGELWQWVKGKLGETGR